MTYSAKSGCGICCLPRMSIALGDPITVLICVSNLRQTGEATNVSSRNAGIEGWKRYEKNHIGLNQGNILYKGERKGWLFSEPTSFFPK